MSSKASTQRGINAREQKEKENDVRHRKPSELWGRSDARIRLADTGSGRAPSFDAVRRGDGPRAGADLAGRPDRQPLPGECQRRGSRGAVEPRIRSGAV